MNLINDFFINAVGVENNPEGFAYLEPVLDQVEFWQDGTIELAYETPELLNAFEHTQEYLIKTYMKVFPDPKPSYASLWKGVDYNASLWHNDCCEGGDVSFLLYMNDTDVDIGGGLQLRDNITGMEQTVYPKKYDIVLFEQRERWDHRGILTDAISHRQVANFGFFTGR